MSAGRGKRRLLAAAIALTVLAPLAWDLTRPPPEQVSAGALLAGIGLYQDLLSPRMEGLGIRCRFSPTCSHYAVGAIRRYGAAGGAWRATWRLLRCGPWTPAGTVDPP